jgi:hypothetical protein
MGAVARLGNARKGSAISKQLFVSRSGLECIQPFPLQTHMQ